MKNADIICNILTSLVYFNSEMSKKIEKPVEIVHFEGENLHVFRVM